MKLERMNTAKGFCTREVSVFLSCTEIITEAYGLLKNMQFDDDPCAIKNYIKKRLSKSNLETILNCTNLTIDPTSSALLQKAQPTSAAVER